MSSYSAKDHRRRFPERYENKKVEEPKVEEPTLLEEAFFVGICSTLGPLGTLLGMLIRKPACIYFRNLEK